MLCPLLERRYASEGAELAGAARRQLQSVERHVLEVSDSRTAALSTKAAVVLPAAAALVARCVESAVGQGVVQGWLCQPGWQGSPLPVRLRGSLLQAEPLHTM